MLRRVNSHEGSEVVGDRGKRDCAGILIPYYWPDGPRSFNYRLRRDHPELTQGSDGKLKPERKYLSPPNGANRLFIPPRVSTEHLHDTAKPIAITEGEKKTLALLRLAHFKSEDPRFIPVGIAGVWNWRGKVGKTGGPKGERLDIKGPISDLNRIEWKDRKVFVIFDANVNTNESVKCARRGIAMELAARGARVQFVNLPEDCGVNGVDDLLAAWGPENVLELFERSVAGSRLDVLLPPEFKSRPEGMFRLHSSGAQALSQVQLTNYQAAIITNIRLDDGVETRREFEIASELMGRPFRFTIPSSEFARMDWPIDQMGAAAITFPNQRDYARTAIQSHSMTAKEQCIYTHTGWRKVDSSWVFLHVGGGIGVAGGVPDVNVRLIGAMGRYKLPCAVPTDLAAAVKDSLQLIELGPRAISFPMFAATCRAVFGDADFALHLAGETGAFKSELAALHQQFFGATMNRLNLPGAWSSTGNALEVSAFQAKDTLFVIDDFAPQGSAADMARYHSAADRVFRAAGNRAGRSRLDSAANLREPKPPRALILSTGEDIPRGHSVRARLLILELSKGSICPGHLSECQEDASAGRYAEAMSGFLAWLAGTYEETRARLEQRASEHRAIARQSPAHPRTPDIVANLQAGFELYLEFSVACGALNLAAAERAKTRCWEALQEAAAAQCKHQDASEPTVAFINILRSLLASGRSHFAARGGGEPDWPQSCGWRRDTASNWTPLGERIGWVDGADIYLEPHAAFRAVQTAAGTIGQSLPVSEQTLRKRLHEKTLLASVDTKRETLTVRRQISGTTISVLHLSRTTVFPDAEAGDVG